MNYHFGLVLGVEDFQTEQEYVRGKAQRHSRDLHGYGVVWGLDVSPDGGDSVKVGPGIAIDPCGRELVLAAERSVDLGGVDDEAVTLYLVYDESTEKPTTSPGGDEPQPRITLETVRIEARPGKPAGDPPSPEETGAQGSAQDVLRALHSAAPAGCTGEAAVEIAAVDLSGTAPLVNLGCRRVVCSTEVLLALVLRLVDRVHALEQRC